MQQDFAYEKLLKVVLIGDSAVGKSGLVNRFVRDVFTSDNTITIGVAFANKDIVLYPSEEEERRKVNGTKVRLQVWDTAGQERYRSLSSAYYRGASGTLLVYDIACRASFENIVKWMKELEDYRDNMALMLVGNKLDLKDLRQVSVEEAQAFAEQHKLLFVETSAKQNVNVQSAFHVLTKEMLKAPHTRAMVMSSLSGVVITSHFLLTNNAFLCQDKLPTEQWLLQADRYRTRQEI
ncbi:Ras- protein Rab-11A, variant 2 [Balamuthia mandrillaris]